MPLWSRENSLLSWFARKGRERREMRRHEILRRGLTIELRDLRPDHPVRVVEIDLGLGPEFWLLLGEQIEVNEDLMRIDQAQLIMDAQKPLRTSRPLIDRGIHPERVLVRF